MGPSEMPPTEFDHQTANTRKTLERTQEDAR